MLWGSYPDPAFKERCGDLEKDSIFDPEGLKKELKERADDPEKVEEIERKIRKCSKITPKRGLERMDT